MRIVPKFVLANSSVSCKIYTICFVLFLNGSGWDLKSILGVGIKGVSILEGT